MDGERRLCCSPLSNSWAVAANDIVALELLGLRSKLPEDESSLLGPAPKESLRARLSSGGLEDCLVLEDSRASTDPPLRPLSSSSKRARRVGDGLGALGGARGETIEL